MIERSQIRLLQCMLKNITIPYFRGSTLANLYDYLTAAPEYLLEQYMAALPYLLKEKEKDISLINNPNVYRGFQFLKILDMANNYEVDDENCGLLEKIIANNFCILIRFSTNNHISEKEIIKYTFSGILLKSLYTRQELNDAIKYATLFC